MKKSFIMTACLFMATLMVNAKGGEWQNEVSLNVTTCDAPLFSGEFTRHYVVRNWFHSGAGLGFGVNTDGDVAIPLYLSEKFLINIPSSEGVTPFFDLQLGTAFMSPDSKFHSFFRPEFGAEFSLKRGNSMTVAWDLTSIGSHGDLGLNIGYKF